MASATNEQAFEVGKLVVGRINWKKIDRDKLQAEVISNPSGFAEEFTRFLANGARCMIQVVVKPFKVWREVALAPKTADEFIAELEQAGMIVSDYAKGMMRKAGFQTVEEPTVLKLARSTVGDLGFTEMPTTDELFARIVEVSGKLLPPEAGPQLRKDCDDQPNGDIFWVAMEQIAGLLGSPSVLFGVKRDDDGKRYLGGDYANPDSRWDLGYEVVFTLGE
ncbi:MAG: hypothetical protein U9M92_01220 [Patescibacteria group bacterium]|nr:hypothetical protein [Patescibacteria group bacterium]